MSLQKALELYAKGNKLCIEGHKLRTYKNYPEDEKLRAKISQLYTESDKLWAEWYRLWDEELIKLFGFIPDFMRDINKYV